MAEFPAMPLWTDAYMADTLDLECDQHGAYLLMLMIAWRRPDNALPGDMSILKRMMAGICSDMHGNRFNRIVPQILARFWTLGLDGKYRQKRLGKERDFLRKTSEKQREKAKKRWRETKSVKDLADAAAVGGAYAPTPTPILEPKTLTQSLDNPESKNPSCEVSGLHSPNGELPHTGNGIAKTRRKAEAQGTRLSEDWEPGKDGIEYARELGLSAEQIRESYGAFMRHWLAKAGQAGRKLRWDLTWQTWVRNDAEKLREKAERDRRWAEQRKHAH